MTNNLLVIGLAANVLCLRLSDCILHRLLKRLTASQKCPPPAMWAITNMRYRRALAACTFPDTRTPPEVC